MLEQSFSHLFKKFVHSEKNSGLVLVACTALSLLLSNLSFGPDYAQAWHSVITIPFTNFGLTAEQWINDGLMTVFFLLVGLEIERELYVGELHPLKKAVLPLGGAIGGMLVPALIFTCFNYNRPTLNGFGIPMGTDIAFALGILSLCGNKVPPAIKVMLTAIAIIDDLGSILIIALFYGKGIHTGFLCASLGLFGVLLLLNRLKVMSLFPYLLLGVVLWYLMMRSGIHPTISGVMLAFACPFGNGGERSPSYRLQSFLHIPVAFLILPLFTLANTAIWLKLEFINGLFSAHGAGIGLGLLVGKPLGILLAVWILIRFGMAKLPEGVSPYSLFSMSVLAGIGFTMSVFITHLAFTGDLLVQSSKMMILLASLLAGLAGFLLFYLQNKGRA